MENQLVLAIHTNTDLANEIKKLKTKLTQIEDANQNDHKTLENAQLQIVELEKMQL